MKSTLSFLFSGLVAISLSTSAVFADVERSRRPMDITFICSVGMADQNAHFPTVQMSFDKGVPVAVRLLMVSVSTRQVVWDGSARKIAQIDFDQHRYLLNDTLTGLVATLKTYRSTSFFRMPAVYADRSGTYACAAYTDLSEIGVGEFVPDTNRYE